METDSKPNLPLLRKMFLSGTLEMVHNARMQHSMT